MPVRSRDAVMEGCQAFIKILPLQKDNEPILLEYGILYNESESITGSDRTQRSNQRRIQGLLLDKLLR